MEVRHEAMKRVFQSLEQENDGQTSRLETSRMPDSDRAKVVLTKMKAGTFMLSFKKQSRKE